jgi:hypothetical protein
LGRLSTQPVHFQGRSPPRGKMNRAKIFLSFSFKDLRFFFSAIFPRTPLSRDNRPIVPRGNGFRNRIRAGRRSIANGSRCPSGRHQNRQSGAGGPDNPSRARVKGKEPLHLRRKGPGKPLAFGEQFVIGRQAVHSRKTNCNAHTEPPASLIFGSEPRATPYKPRPTSPTDAV